MQRVLVCLACGVILTVVLTGIGLSQGSREGVCLFIWQGCLVQLILNATDTPVDGGSTMRLVQFHVRSSLGRVAGRAHLLADKLWFSHSLCACLKETEY